MKNTVKILYFIIKQQTFSIKSIDSLQSSIVFVGKVLFIISTLINGFVVSLFLKDANYSEKKDLLVILLIGFLIVGILKDFIPNYISQTNYLPFTLPTSFVRRTMINITTEVYSIFYLCQILFFSIYIISLNLYSDIYLVILSFIMTFLVKFFIKNIIESNFRDFFSLISFSIFTLFILLLYNYHIDKELIIVLGFGFLSLAYWITPYFFKRIDFSKKRLQLPNICRRNFVLITPSSRITIVLYLFVKVLFFCFITIYKSKLKDDTLVIWLLSIIVFPVMLYTYLFNNLFG